MFEETRAVRAGPLDADAQQLAVAAQPLEQLSVTCTCRLEVTDVEDLAPFVDHRRDVNVLVGIDAADDDALNI